MSGVLRIGTSGIVLPGPKKTFPPEFQAGTRLQYYSTVFNTLEINSTFYKLPRAHTFDKWATEVDKDFRFTCKLPRGITHAKKLMYQSHEIESFMNASAGLAEKKGCLLIQFPASIKTDCYIQVSEILRYVSELDRDPKWNICVEFRDMNWYENKSIHHVCDDLDVSIVLHDMPNSKTPFHLSGNPVYLRFHGPTGDYKGGYSDEFLESYAVQIKDWIDSGKDVYVYFNNTAGEAFQNAQFLKAKLVNTLHHA